MRGVTVFLITAFGCTTCGLMAQTSDASALPAADPVIRVSVNLVQVDAVVTDAKGNHITDLKPVDFDILEDGKPQKITKFSWIHVAPDAPSSNAQTAAQRRNMQRQEVRRSIVLMVDDLGTEYRDVVGVISTVRRFVADQMGPNDLAAVTASRGGMGFYQQFTNDKEQLYSAIDHLSHRPGFGQWAIETPRGIDLSPGEPAFGYRDAGNPPNPIGYLTWAIQGLQDVPGRKAVVLFSTRLNVPQSVINLANRAGVVVYVICPAGTGCGYEPPDSPLRSLAEKTGGLFVRSVAGGRELDEDLGKVLRDMNDYYLLGYQPDRTDFESSPGRSVHHSILVTSNRAGLIVRARSGFMGVPDPALKSAPRKREEFVQQALFSPFSVNGIRLHIDPLYEASTPDPKTKKRLPLLRVMVSIDGTDVKFVDGQNGRKKLTLDVLVGVFNQDGTSAGRKDQRYEISATPEEAGKLASSGLGYILELALRHPGPYQVRAAVRDAGTEAIGSAYSFVELPDFNRSGIVLSSIALSPGTVSDNDIAKSLGWSKFAVGTKVHFACEVFGTQNAPQGESKVEMEVRLYRDGTSVFETQPLAIVPEEISAHLLTGDIQLNKELAPGDYTIQLVAHDHLAGPKKQTASQWADFVVVPAQAPH